MKILLRWFLLAAALLLVAHLYSGVTVASFGAALGAALVLGLLNTLVRPLLVLLEGPGQGRKLGGILIETVTVGDRRMCVVGVGLNIRPQPAEGVAHGYACLQEIDPAASAPST